MLMKVAGELARLNRQTVTSNSPNLVLKVILSIFFVDKNNMESISNINFGKKICTLDSNT
jgi:hypothetical protein